MDYEEYEVIPTSPIRNLEKRISKIETTSTTSETRRLVEQIIELIKSNQRIIDDVIKADSELREEISRIPGKIDDLLMAMHEFMELLKTSATEETVSNVSKDVMGPMVKKFDELLEQNKKNMEISQASLTSLGIIDKRLKRLSMQPTQAGYRR